MYLRSLTPLIARGDMLTYNTDFINLARVMHSALIIIRWRQVGEGKNGGGP
jgi:hypothetical protein